MTNDQLKQFMQLCMGLKGQAICMHESFSTAVDSLNDEVFNLCESYIDDFLYAMNKVHFALDMLEMTLRHEENE